MPILEIEIVLQPGEVLVSDLAQIAADRLGEVFGSPPGNTWVRLRFLPAGQYAENGDAPGVYPVFVTVLKAQLPEPQALQQELSELTRLLAEVFTRPEENVHILYLPPGAGRVAFGGRLMPSPENPQSHDPDR
jgi:phenylpyruvate tautomerase PptA (4-oxalocrotonate tautomerase family)